MADVASLRAFKATRSLTPTQGQLGARRLVAALEGASSNMLRFALARQALPDTEPKRALAFLREHLYLERDRCEACGKETRRGWRVCWSNKERRVYACNKQCARRALRNRGVK